MKAVVKPTIFSNSQSQKIASFYEKVFGAKAYNILKYKDIGINSLNENSQMQSTAYENCYFHCAINIGGLELNFVDFVDSVLPFDKVIHTEKYVIDILADPNRLGQIYDKLSKDAEFIVPPILDKNGGLIHCVVRDKFGIGWSFNSLPAYRKGREKDFECECRIAFQGNAEEAICFYERIFGGKASGRLYLKDAGWTEDFKDKYPVMSNMPDALVSSSFQIGNMKFSAMDFLEECESFSTSKVPDRYGISIFVSLDDARKLYKELSNGGKIIVPPLTPKWADRHCVVRDNFGIMWIIIAGETVIPL
jgi:PhnB protein